MSGSNRSPIFHPCLAKLDIVSIRRLIEGALLSNLRALDEDPDVRVIVITGSPKAFAAGDYQVPCALIIGKRKESTNKKTSLNNALREYNVAI